MSYFQDSWPILMSEEELSKYPQFTSLLTRLGDKLTPNGCSYHVQKKMDLAKRTITQSRYNWLMNHVIYHELYELLTDLDVRGQEGTLSLDEKQFHQVFTKTMSYNEIPDYLHFLPSLTSKSTLFGLSESDIKRHNPVSNHLEEFQQVVIPMLEEKLRKKCEDLYNFYDPSKSQESTSDRLLVAKATSLPALVEQKQQTLNQMKLDIKKDRITREFWTYYQKLLESLSIMETIIKEYKFVHQSNADEVTVEWLKARCDALCLKVRLTQLQILCDTYTTESVKALRKIGEHLDNEIKQTETELTSTTQSLQAYHAIGVEFKTLVGHYTQLQKEIENRRWGLEQLMKGGEGKEEGAIAPQSSPASIYSTGQATGEKSSTELSGDVTRPFGGNNQHLKPLPKKVSFDDGYPLKPPGTEN
ncbi:HAUS augmin-like complex subunit 4 [Physella acuta]|uniref:HAUS augmin-like complex subunit 4 n=1 Tax=Physella acuta TaxID=109671 RepID=UPI0027DABF51|nr:HAUS augmin-like complex subunit 4 [Physella acuta]